MTSPPFNPNGEAAPASLPPGSAAPPPWKRLLQLLAALAVLAGLTVALLRPTPDRMAHAFLPDRGDPVFNLYVLSWGIHQLQTGLPDFWDAGFFYPSKKALTLSDHLIGPAAFGWALAPWGPNPIVVYNLLILGSFVLTGGATFWVLRRSGASFWAALLASCGYAFSAFRWTHLNHIQILLMGCIPLVLWTFDRLLAERSARWALAFLAVYLLHVSGGAYLAYMIHFPLAALFASRVASEGRKLLRPAALALLGIVAAFALAADLALFLPYREAQKELGVERRAREIQTLGANLVSYLTPSSRNLYGKPIRQALAGIGRPPREATLFPGFFTLAAATLGLLAWLRGARRAEAPPLSAGKRAALVALGLLVLAAFTLGEMRTLGYLGRVDPPGLSAWNREALVLLVSAALLLLLDQGWREGGKLDLSAQDPWLRGVALGGLLTFLLSFPIVFAPLAQALPGMGGMRAPARFFAFTGFALALFAARGLDLLRARIATPGGRAALLAGAGALVLVDAVPVDFKWMSLPTREEQPPVYHWLAGDPVGGKPGPPGDPAGAKDVRALLELPMKGGSGETPYMWAATVHWKPIANGYSGFLPAPYRELAEICRPLPDGAALARLRQLGVTHLLIHTRDERARNLRRLLPAWTAEHEGHDLERVYDDGKDRVERILPKG
jgi:hypothetical protein